MLLLSFAGTKFWQFAGNTCLNTACSLHINSRWKYFMWSFPVNIPLLCADRNTCKLRVLRTLPSWENESMQDWNHDFGIYECLLQVLCAIYFCIQQPMYKNSFADAILYIVFKLTCNNIFCNILSQRCWTLVDQINR